MFACTPKPLLSPGKYKVDAITAIKNGNAVSGVRANLFDIKMEVFGDYTFEIKETVRNEMFKQLMALYNGSDGETSFIGDMIDNDLFDIRKNKRMFIKQGETGVFLHDTTGILIPYMLDAFKDSLNVDYFMYRLVEDK